MLAIYAETFKIATLTGARTSALLAARNDASARSERAAPVDPAPTESRRAGKQFSEAQQLNR